MFKQVYNAVARFNLTEATHRANLFSMMKNFFRLILTMAPYIPANPTPVFLEKDNIEFFGTEFVLKRIPNAYTCPQALYSLLATGSVPNAVRVEFARNNRYLTITLLEFALQ